MLHILSDVIIWVWGVLSGSMTYLSRAGVIQYTSPQLKMLSVPSQHQEGLGHDTGDDDAGAKAELLSLKKIKHQFRIFDQTKRPHSWTKPIEAIQARMKYSQACLLKKQGDVTSHNTHEPLLISFWPVPDPGNQFHHIHTTSEIPRTKCPCSNSVVINSQPWTYL